MTRARRPPGRPPGPLPDPVERRRLLLDAAEAAIAAHGPAVSMEQIAEQAEVSKATLYDNFDGKGGLTAALMERTGGRLLAAFADSLDGVGGEGGGLPVKSVLRGGIRIFARHVEGSSELYRFVLRNSDDDALAREVAAPIAGVLASVIGEAADGPRSTALAHAAVGAIVTATEWWSEAGGPREDFEELLADFVWGGMVAAGVPDGDEPADLAPLAAALAEGLAEVAAGG